MAAPNPTHVVAIVGCAGRRHEASLMSSKLFELMVCKSDELIQRVADAHHCNVSNIHLVSGGSAWTDHCAVKLFLTGRFGGLTLHLPCAFDVTKTGFSTNNAEGVTLNFLHRQMSSKVNSNTLGEIATAIARGADVKQHASFLLRNIAIADQCNTLMAFTWGVDAPPAQSGTRVAWDSVGNSTKQRMHVPLSKLQVERIAK
jgi:hypothetical protein